MAISGGGKGEWKGMAIRFFFIILGSAICLLRLGEENAATPARKYKFCIAWDCLDYANNYVLPSNRSEMSIQGQFQSLLQKFNPEEWKNCKLSKFSQLDIFSLPVS